MNKKIDKIIDRISEDIIYNINDIININEKINKDNNESDSENDLPFLSYIDGIKSFALRIDKNENRQHRNSLIYISDKQLLLPNGRTYERKIREIYSTEYNFSQFPNIKSKRDCLYVCAPNQSGKTTYISEYLSNYVKIFHEKKIFLFSSLKEDPIIDKFKPIRIIINEEFLNNPLDISLFNNSMVIFDDVDQINNTKIKKEIYKIIDEILCNGAHFYIDIIITNHLMTNYKETRIILNECSSITIFPNSGTSHHIYYTLKNYCGFSKEQIDKVMKIKSRWVTIFKNYPICVLHTKGCYLI